MALQPLDERWRLRKGTAVMICGLKHDDLEVTLILRRDDEIVLSEQFPTAAAALHRVDALRREFLASGWTGLFER